MHTRMVSAYAGGDPAARGSSGRRRCAVRYTAELFSERGPSGEAGL